MKYPVKLRVTFEGVSEYYQSIFDLSKIEFEKLTAPRISIDLKFIRDQLKEIERTAQNAVNKLDPFSFSDFEKDFIRNNNLFRQRKFKLELPLQSSNEFDRDSESVISFFARTVGSFEWLLLILHKQFLKILLNE